MGGFSNGAHTTTVLLFRPEQEISRYFKYYFLIEGGGHGHTSNTDSLKDNSLIVLKSGEKGREDMDRMVAVAQEHGASIEYVTMKDTGHKFPETYYGTVMEWINKRAFQN